MATTPNMGLTTWPNLTDFFDHTALKDNFDDLDAHDHTSGKGTPIPAGGLASGSVATATLQDSSVITSKVADLAVTNAKLANTTIQSGKIADSAITGPKLTSTLKEQGALNDGVVVRRGKSIIATEESRTNTAYGLLTTPDQVSGIVLPADGLIVIAYQATWKESVDATATASIFIGTNQLKLADAGSAAPVANEAVCEGGANVYMPLATTGGGLIGTTAATATAYTGDVTTGQIITSTVANGGGGPCYVFAAAGTYDVSVRFKSSSGTVTVKDRKLWVWTIGF